MSLFGRFIPRGGIEQRGSGMEQRTLNSSSFVPPPAAGVIDDYVGVHRAMANMTVLACVRLLADTIASLPWKAYRRDGKGIPKELKPQPALISQPFPGFDLFEWKWMVVASMALRGNSYHLVTSRDKYGYPNALLPLHPDIVFLERRPDILMWFDPIYRVMGEPAPREDIVHMRRFTLPGEPWGMSPVRQAAIAIGMGLSAEEYGYRYFKESANPSGILTTDSTDLDEEAIQRLQMQWIQSHGGRRLPAFLTGGFKWQNLSITPEESQFLETRQFQRSEICLMYGVPPILIGDTKETTAWGTGVEQITLGAVTYTFRPWTSLIESCISSLLPRGQFVRFDYNALLRGDVETRYKTHQVAIASGFKLRNEVRAEEEMDPVQDGDIMYVPSTSMPVGYTPTMTVPIGTPAPGMNPSGKPANPGTLPMPPVGGGEHSPAAGAGQRDEEFGEVETRGNRQLELTKEIRELEKQRDAARGGTKGALTRKINELSAELQQCTDAKPRISARNEDATELDRLQAEIRGEIGGVASTSHGKPDAMLSPEEDTDD